MKYEKKRKLFLKLLLEDECRYIVRNNTGELLAFAAHPIRNENLGWWHLGPVHSRFYDITWIGVYFPITWDDGILDIKKELELYK